MTTRPRFGTTILAAILVPTKVDGLVSIAIAAEIASNKTAFAEMLVKTALYRRKFTLGDTHRRTNFIFSPPLVDAALYPLSNARQNQTGFITADSLSPLRLRKARRRGRCPERRGLHAKPRNRASVRLLVPRMAHFPKETVGHGVPSGAHCSERKLKLRDPGTSTVSTFHIILLFSLQTGTRGRL